MPVQKRIVSYGTVTGTRATHTRPPINYQTSLPTSLSRSSLPPPSLPPSWRQSHLVMLCVPVVGP
eukprot:2034929-Rhodomonas_salina.1